MAPVFPGPFKSTAEGNASLQQFHHAIVSAAVLQPMIVFLLEIYLDAKFAKNYKLTVSRRTARYDILKKRLLVIALWISISTAWGCLRVR